MKKIVLIILGVMLSLPSFARDFKYTYEGQTLTYTVIDEVSKTVEVYQSYVAVSGDLKIPEIAKDGEIEYTVTSIGRSAFLACSRLTSVTIPNSVISIDDAAFLGCSSLRNLTIEDGETTLALGGYNENFVGKLFGICPLEILYLGRNLSYKTDGSSRESPFYNQSGLKSLIIGNSVTEIGDGAFYGCSGLTSVTIPNSVTAIGRFTFFRCSGLTSVTIPGSVTSIDGEAFSGCTSLKSVKIQNVNTWSLINFGNYYANPIFYAKTFTVGNSDEPVRHLDLDLGEETISPYAFYNASNLETVRVKAGTIGKFAFIGCSNVTKLCLDVDDLSEKCFADNSKIEAIYCLSETPPAASDNSFSKYEGVKLYVPKGCVSKYENAETCWWRFLDIYESDFSDLDSIFKADYVNSIRDINVDKGNNAIDYSLPYEVYNLSGIRVANTMENLASGIYIVRQGTVTKKFAVR